MENNSHSRYKFKVSKVVKRRKKKKRNVAKCERKHKKKEITLFPVRFMCAHLLRQWRTKQIKRIRDRKIEFKEKKNYFFCVW